MEKKNNIVNRSLEVKYNQNRRDCVYTPEDLAVKLIKQIKVSKTDVLLDPASGSGVFYRNFPADNRSHKCEIEKGSDYFKFNQKVDWIITNPPYSILNRYLEHSLKLSQKGIAFLVGSYSLTPLRMEMIEKAGFKISKLHYFKVSNWFGIQCFMVLQKNHPAGTEVTYSRKVYQCSNHIKRSINQKAVGDYGKN